MRSIKTAYTYKQAKIYDDIRFKDNAGKTIHSMELSLLKFFLGFASSKKNILEIGCGTGRILIELFKLGYQVDGIDASKNMLKKLLEKARLLNITVNLKQFESANLKIKKKYDFVYAIRLLNQTESKNYALKTIKEMIRVTKPGGYILAEFVNINRPRIGRNSTKTTRLSHKMISKSISSENWKCKIISNKGLFFFGMGTIIATPSLFLNLIVKLDTLFSKLLPKYCSRGYIFLKKDEKKV
jgi:ubiquinone/menaquinone biosynthesis C-methylase UbiE